jgi:hypothetical protein
MASEKPEGGQTKITAKDAAATTAMGSAFRMGTALRRAKTGDTAAGAAVGTSTAKSKKKAAEASGWLTALVVVGLMLGTLAVMIAFGK